MKTQLSHTIILILLIALVIFFGSNYNLEGFNKLSPGEYPKDDIYPLLTSSYPYIGKDQLSNQTYFLNNYNFLDSEILEKKYY